MATFDITWAFPVGFEDQPAGSSPANALDARIQELKKAIRQRTEIEHYWAGDGDDGIHKLPYLAVSGRDALDDNVGQVVLSSDAARISYNDGSVWQGLVGFDIGDLKTAAYLSAPFGWLLCNGLSVLRAGIYNDLFDVIGELYGSVDGTHFNVPQLQNNVPVGVAGSGTFTALGDTDGSFTHTLNTPELASHDHTFTGTPLANHTHGYQDVSNPQFGGTATFDGGGAADHEALLSQTDAAGAHTPAGTISFDGGGDPHQNTQPSIAVQYFIRYA